MLTKNPRFRTTSGPDITMPKVPQHKLDGIGIESLLLNKQICFALYSASLAITNAYRPLLWKLGLTYSQYLVMIVLWEDDGLVVKEIGARLFLDSGTLTGLLKRLEKSGFVRRERVAEDERQVRIKLTDQGHDLQGPVALVQAQVSCMTHLSLGEMMSLTQTVSQLRDTLDTANTVRRSRSEAGSCEP